MRYLVVLLLSLIAAPLLAQTNVGPFYIGAANFPQTNTGFQMNASGEGVAFIFARSSGDEIAGVGLRLGTVTAAEDLVVSLETVGTDGQPTGTNYAGSTAGTLAAGSQSSDTTVEVTLGTATSTAAAGDLLCVRVEFSSFSSGNLEIDTGGNLTTIQAFPKVMHDSGSGFAYQTGKMPMLYLRLAGGGYEVPIGCVPPGTIGSSANIQSDTSPDEIAFQYTAPVTMRLIGVSFYGREFGSTELIDFEVFDDAGSPASQSNTTSMSHDTSQWTNQGGVFALGQTTLTASSTYNISIFSNDASNNTTIYYFDVANAAHWGNYMQGISWATRTDAGAFTETTTRKPLGGLWFDQITTSGSSVAFPVTSGPTK